MVCVYVYVYMFEAAYSGRDTCLLIKRFTGLIFTQDTLVLLFL